MRKGQIFGQIFIYVVAIVIVAFLLVFGYRAISTFQDQGNNVQLVQFKNNIENSVETISLDFGTVRTKEFSVPDNIREVCFVTSHPTISELSGTNYPLIEDSVNSGVQNNLFLVSNKLEESFNVGSIVVNGDMLCVPKVAGSIRIRLEGKGNHALISS